MKIDKTYIRTSKNGDTTEVTPKNQEQVDYYRSLEDSGFKFEPKVVIHSTPEICESCQ